MLRRATTALIVTMAMLVAMSAAALTGGPDGFGYTFIDSDEAGGPVYSWIDVSGTATDIGISDDGEYTIALPFPLWFYGEVFHTVTYGDGALVFGADDELANQNQCVPANNSDGDDALVMGLWDDLNAEEAAAGGGVFVDTVGTAPDRMVVVQLVDVPHYGSKTYFSFEIVLVETTNQILVQFASVDSAESSYALGASATVGIQPDCDDGLEYSCATNTVLHDGLAVLFDVVCDDLDGDGVGPCDGDCDDADPTVGPTIPEDDDGLDNDCDGLVDEDFVNAGDLVISELMIDPAAATDLHGEWFEVTNVSARAVDLTGWTLADEGGGATLDGGVVPAGGIALFAADGDAASNGGLPPVDVVIPGGITMANTRGELVLLMGGVELDRVTYDSEVWLVDAGVSLYLDPDYLDAGLNDDPYPWCQTPVDGAHDISGVGDGDYGTPGVANPAGLCCSDGDGDGSSTCDGDCDDGDAERYPGHPEVLDAIDNDCDGLADEDQIGPGAVLVTEFMDDPAAVEAATGEWFEVFNPSSSAVNLVGWTVADAYGGGFTVEGDLVIEAGGFAVLAASGDPAANGNLPVVDYVYDYDALPLRSFDDDEIVLLIGDLEVDALAYRNVAPWGSERGRSLALDPDITDAAVADDAAYWCVTPDDGTYDYGGAGSGDHGTPGVTNPVCCVDADGDGATSCVEDCDDGDAAIGPDAAEDCADGVDNDCDELTDLDDPDCEAGGDDDDSSDSGVSVVIVGDDDDRVGCACRAGGGSGSGPAMVGLLALALISARRRRRTPRP